MILDPLRDEDDRSFSIVRAFAAPQELVFRYFTEAPYVQQWWGIKGSSVPRCELDVRPGGLWRIDMRTASGKVYRNHGAYLEVVPHELLVFTDIPDAEIAEWKGQPPGIGVHTITLRWEADKTVVTQRVQLTSRADRDLVLGLGMSKGLNEGFDRLEETLAAAIR